MEQNRPIYPPPGLIAPRRPAPAGLRFLANRHSAPSAADLCVALAVASAPAIVLSIVVARYGFDSLSVRILAALTLYVNFMIVLRNLHYGLALFIVAAGMSPKLPGFYNNLRVEDLVFVLVFSVWFIKALQHGRIPLVHSPIVLPFLLLTLMSVFSTAWGLGLDAIPHVKYSIFLQAKRIEYFLIFWVVATTVRSEGWLRLLAILFVVSGAIAATYGLSQAQNDIYLTVADTRVTGPEGENYNTLSGYLVVCICAGLAILPAFPRGRTRTLLATCTIIAGLGLLRSYSREGYIMLMGSLLVFGFARQRWVLLAAGLALIAALAVSNPVRQHVTDTVQKVQGVSHDEIGSNSLTARFSTWGKYWNGWFLQQPLVGKGVGSLDLEVDSEYLLRACEVGVIGFVFFAWWLVAISRQVKRLMRTSGFSRALAIGLAAGFVGLLIQGVVAVSFNTIRTMEPFWYLLGLVSAGALICRPTSGPIDPSTQPVVRLATGYRNGARHP
jgi:hypothetical protein